MKTGQVRKLSKTLGGDRNIRISFVTAQFTGCSVESGYRYRLCSHPAGKSRAAIYSQYHGTTK